MILYTSLERMSDKKSEQEQQEEIKGWGKNDKQSLIEQFVALPTLLYGFQTTLKKLHAVFPSP